MSFRERSAWMMVGTLVIAYGWYLTTVIGQLDGDTIAGIEYQRTAVVAAIAVVVLAALSHIVLGATGQTRSKESHSGTAAIKRYARSTGGVVVSAAAVLGMALAMVEADHFWIANVILAGLVVAELAAAGSEILIYRRGAHEAGSGSH
ncbi:MAG: hypothetical protein PVJ28_00725 [Acidimicrobiia bacterium]|jgi:hypothetical protein